MKEHVLEEQGGASTGRLVQMVSRYTRKRRHVRRPDTCVTPVAGLSNTGTIRRRNVAICFQAPPGLLSSCRHACGAHVTPRLAKSQNARSAQTTSRISSTPSTRPRSTRIDSAWHEKRRIAKDILLDFPLFWTSCYAASRDPEVACGPHFARGVREGPGTSLPRLPVLHRPKRKWRLADLEDTDDYLKEELPGGRENYSSVAATFRQSDVSTRQKPERASAEAHRARSRGSNVPVLLWRLSGQTEKTSMTESYQHAYSSTVQRHGRKQQNLDQGSRTCTCGQPTSNA